MYIVGYLSLFDGELLQEKVSAESEADAVRKYLVKHQFSDHESELDGLSIEELCQFARDCDSFVNVIAV